MAAIRSIQGRRNVDPDIVERLTAGVASIDAEVVVKAYDVNPLFYHPVVDDTAAMRRRAMTRLREGLTPGLRERFNPTAAQMDRGVFRGRFGAVDIESLSRSGFVHGVAAVRSDFVQAAASMPQIISQIGVTTLHAQGLLGTGQRIAMIDRRFYPQIMGAALVWEECFCATQCCPNGTARQSGPGSSLTAGTVSTPMVAACAALLKQARPAATAAQIANALSQSPTQVIFPGAGGAGGKANIQRPRIDCAVALAALPPAATGPSLNEHGISGFWYNPTSNGQGLAVEVYPNLIAPNVGLMSGSWYTFAPAPAGGPERQRWYTFDGAAATGSATAQLTVRRNIDGNFAQPPPTTAAAVGTATLTMTSCTTATLSYALNDGSGSGSMPLTRLTPNVSCTNSGTGGRFHPDFALSGFFNDPNLNGQGIFLELNPNLPVLAAGWYSYTRASIPGGSPRQRWYTLQLGNDAVGARSFSGVPILATTGGTFNGQPSTATTQVGSAHLQLLGCGGASLSYAFTAGENAGLSGNIALARTGPAPPGCQ